MIELYGDVWSPGDRVQITCTKNGEHDGWGTVHRTESGGLIVLLDGKMAAIDIVGSVRACACAHGECDDCRLARGEDPQNYTEDDDDSEDEEDEEDDDTIEESTHWTS